MDSRTNTQISENRQEAENIYPEIQRLALQIKSLLHKFNNELFMISGQAQLLAELVPGSKVQHDMELIFEKIQQAAHILKDIYLLSRQYQNIPSAPPSGTVHCESQFPTGMKKILIADSDFMNLEVLIDLLESEGNIVWAAQNLPGMLDQIRNCRPDYILVDENLPELNLRDLADMLDCVENFKKTRILLMTSHPERSIPGVQTVAKPVKYSMIASLCKNDD